MTTHANKKETEARLADFRHYLQGIITDKIDCKESIGRHNAAITQHLEAIEQHQTNIDQHRTGIASDEKNLHAIRCELGETLMHRTKLPAVLDMYLRPIAGIDGHIKAHSDNTAFPGQICYEAACEQGDPRTGEALHVLNALSGFGFPAKALEARLVEGKTDRAVIGISVIKKNVLEDIINAMVARRLPHAEGDTPENVRIQVIHGIIDVPREHTALHAPRGNGVEPRSLKPAPANGNGGYIKGNGAAGRPNTRW